MHSFLNDGMDLVLRWTTNCECTICFSPVNQTELSISAQVTLVGGLSYQGKTTVTLQSMCYGYDLARFATRLDLLSQSGTQAASLVNAGEDFEICIDTQEKSGDRIFLTKLRYRFGPCINDGHCCNEIMLEIGPAEAIEQTAKLIRDWIQMLELDCTHPCAKSD